jgi:hypothetical protein
MGKKVSWKEFEKKSQHIDKSTEQNVNISTNQQIDKSTGYQAKGKYLKADGTTLKKITFYLPIDLVKKIKDEAFKREASGSEIAQRVFEEYFKNEKL